MTSTPFGRVTIQDEGDSALLFDSHSSAPMATNSSSILPAPNNYRISEDGEGQCGVSRSSHNERVFVAEFVFPELKSPSSSDPVLNCLQLANSLSFS